VESLFYIVIGAGASAFVITADISLLLLSFFSLSYVSCRANVIQSRPYTTLVLLNSWITRYLDGLFECVVA